MEGYIKTVILKVIKMKINSGIIKIVHNFGYKITDIYEEKLRVVKSEIEQLKQEGYDGFVNNVCFFGNYLDDPEEWKLMLEKAKLCKSLGMRLWIYDERGYPSGTAKTHTLDENPDCEARAAVMVAKLLKKGEQEYFPLPKGHNKPISAFGYYINGDKATEEELETAPVKAEYTDKGFYFKNDGDKKLLCLCFFEKFVFEGAHCHHNCHSARRYIDLGNKAAGDAFINNTYRKYCDCLEEYINDGTVEAFFTDEPSYMGVYINLTLTPNETDHTVDNTIPLYPLVNWSKDLKEKFLARFGYSITDNMTALFMGNGETFCRVRYDFYTLLSELAENAYFGNIGSFCEERNTRFSGHLLLEDKLHDHIPFEGNFFSYLSKMHIPGMDMLNSIPELIWENAFTPVLVKSVSDIYRDGNVMDEVSAHMQGGKVNTEEIFVSLALQYCLGANIFTLYYGDRLLEKTGGGNTVLEKMQEMEHLHKNREFPKVVLHYPIETMMRNRKPSIDEAVEVKDKNQEIIEKCENSMLECMYTVLNAQLPLMFSDTASIDRLFKNPPRYFIVPFEEITCEFNEKLNLLKNCGTTIIYADKESLKDTLKNSGLVKTDGDTMGVASLWSDNGLLIVNSDKKEKHIYLNFIVENISDCWYNRNVNFKISEGKTEITLRPYGVYSISL